MKKYLVILLCFFTLGLSAQLPPRPVPAKLYNNLSKNFPDFLTAQEAQQLEEKLEVFSNETSNQICVVIVDDLGNYEPMEFATGLINEWGIGQKDKNNGVVILLQLKPEGGGRDFIAIGYGLEGAIPDLATKKVREEELYPNLKAGKNFAALDASTERLMQLARGEINVKNYTRSKHKENNSAITIIIIVLAVIFLLRAIFAKGGRTIGRDVGRGIFWGNMMGGGFGRGFGGGGGGFGGGGGGFGGFGGGSAGGGGSGGSW